MSFKKPNVLAKSSRRGSTNSFHGRLWMVDTVVSAMQSMVDAIRQSQRFLRHSAAKIVIAASAASACR